MPGKRVSGVLALCLAVALTCGGCGMSQEQHDYTIYGAVTGAALAGAIGAGVFAADNSANWPAVPAGIVGGAIIGGVIGYLMAPPPPPPPPQPQPVPPPTPSPPPPAPEKLILRGVHFDFDKYNIRPQDAAVLDEAAGILKSHPTASVNVNGYCDSIGTVRYNLKLSQRRAEAVVRYLADHGVAENRLIPHGYGKTNFVASNASADGRAQNRRVELVPIQ
jgi:outer membrane protein OmpA-like peptidoglycan-associated protein